MRRIVVVGASLAGPHTAHALRRHGYAGDVTIVGEEAHLAYDRPPLSKHMLDGTMSRQQLDLPISGDLQATWRLGHPAVALDIDTRQVHLADGEAVPYDGLVISTGARART